MRPDARSPWLNQTNCEGPVDIGKMYSRPYTIWTTGSGDSPNYMMSVGEASDCNGGDPKQFTLTGTEISGCSAPPKIILYDTPDKSGLSWVLDNTSMHDMTRERHTPSTEARQQTPTIVELNDNIRAIELVSGHWEICEDIEYGGTCLGIYSKTPTSIRLDTGWNGNWDKRISSVRPKACQ